MTDTRISVNIGGYSWSIPQSVVDAGASAVASWITQETLGGYTPPLTDVEQALSSLKASSATASPEQPAAEADQPVAAPADTAEDTSDTSASPEPAPAERVQAASASVEAQQTVPAPQIVEVPTPYIIYVGNDNQNITTPQTTAQEENTILPESSPVAAPETAPAASGGADLPLSGDMDIDATVTLMDAPDVSQQVLTVLEDIRDDIDFLIAGRPLLSTSFSDYSVSEGLLLTLALLVVGKFWVRMIERGFSWLI